MEDKVRDSARLFLIWAFNAVIKILAYDQWAAMVFVGLMILAGVGSEFGFSEIRWIAARMLLVIIIIAQIISVAIWLFLFYHFQRVDKVNPFNFFQHNFWLSRVTKYSISLAGIFWIIFLTA